MLSSPAVSILVAAVTATLGVIFIMKASSISDIMWTRNESLTRLSRLLAAPRRYYLWLCRIGGIVLSAVGAIVLVSAVAQLLT